MGGTADYAGPGLSVYFHRAIHFDLDLLDAGSDAPFQIGGVVATVGGDLYSEFLGDGERTFLNPHLGLAGGYADLSEADTWSSFGVVSGVAGVELLSLPVALVDVNGRLLGLLGQSGNRLGWEATVSGHLAF